MADVIDTPFEVYRIGDTNIYVAVCHEHKRVFVVTIDLEKGERLDTAPWLPGDKWEYEVADSLARELAEKYDYDITEPCAH